MVVLSRRAPELVLRTAGFVLGPVLILGLTPHRPAFAQGSLTPPGTGADDEVARTGGAAPADAVKAPIRTSLLPTRCCIARSKPNHKPRRTLQFHASPPRSIGWALTLATICCLRIQPARAALRTWDGGGANSNWTTATNWVDDLAPVAGDNLLFPSGAARQLNNNNFPAGTTFNSLIFSGGSYVLDGNPIALNAGILATNGSDHKVFNPLTLNSNQTFMLSLGSSGFYLPGAVNLNGKHLTIAVRLLTIAQVQAVISGPGSLIKAGAGSLSLYASHAFSGPLQLTEGTITLYHAGALGATNGSTEIGATGTLNLLNTVFLAEPLLVSGTLRTVGAGTKVLTGPITLTATNATIETTSDNLLTINGLLIGSGGFN
jgi:autotransporter-associated beta strand protein